MLPVLIGLGIGALLLSAFSDEEEEKPKKRKRSTNDRTSKKKIFISFAIEDKKYRDFLVSQAKNERTPFSFVDMSVKEPWTQKVWKEKCREKIQKCDGMIVLLSKNTWHSGGSRWEITCAKEENVPVVGMHIKKNDRGAKPPELYGKKVIDWTWDNLDESISKF
ncbi:MAG: TIR domain-containing protein [Bacteroidetes bacterium]|nr:TIR domain-containing protein [Bacteroidota bacterium]